MKHYFIFGEATAGIGVLAAVFHILPSFIGAVAGALAAIWYGILIYDRLTKRKNNGYYQSNDY